MNNNGLKDLSLAELQERLEAEKTQLTKLRINHAVSPVENPSLIRKALKGIARINTEIRFRQLCSKDSANK